MVIAINIGNYEVMGFESVQSYKDWATEAAKTGLDVDWIIQNQVHEIEENEMCNEENEVKGMYDFHCSLYDLMKPNYG